MKKLITLLIIAFTFNGLQAGITLTKKYSKTTYTWNTTNKCRDADYNNGKVYVVENNSTSSTIHVINAETGDEITAENVVNAYFNALSVTSDKAGVLYVPTNNTGGGSNFMLTKVDLPNTVSKINNHSNVGAGIRTDFIEAYKVDASTTYVAGASINATTQVVRVWTISGTNISGPVSFQNIVASSSGADIKWIDASKILLTGQSRIPAIVNLNMSDGTFTKTDIGTTAYAFGGSAYFKVLGTPFVVLPTNGFGAFKVFDITNPASPVEKVAATDNIGAVTNAGVHMGFEVVVNGNKATIYVFSSNNGLAAYEMEVPAKTFTVTAPQGTEKVYVAGTFTFKNWDNTTPYELTATANPNEFTGTFACEDGVEYKYLNGVGNWEYQEASSLGSTEYNAADGTPVKPSDGTNRSYNASDVVSNWKAVSKLVLKADITAGGIPSDLYVKGGWDGWTTATAMAKNGTFDYTVTIGDGVDDVIYSNSGYKYYTTDLGSPENWETRSGNRWAIYPSMTDEIAGFNTLIPSTGMNGKKVDVQIIRTSNGITAKFSGQATIELYNVNGGIIDRTIATDVYTRDLSEGMYIIRVNGQAQKFVR
ncbi:MAG: hypothetical protein VB102_08115 [Paludibacter sp.]|nr:hypothetical protein [Paludibacter sp.]